jgi:hypothetical protein
MMDKNLEFLYRFISTYPEYDWTSSVLALLILPNTEKEIEKLLELNPKFFLVIAERVFPCNGAKGYLISKIYWSLVLSNEKEYTFTQALNDLQWYTGKEHSEKDVLSLVRDEKLLLDSARRSINLNPLEQITRVLITAGPPLYDLLWGFLLRYGELKSSTVLKEAPFLKNHPAFLQKIRNYENGKTEAFSEEDSESLTSGPPVSEPLAKNKRSVLHRFLLSYPEKDWNIVIMKSLLSFPTNEVTKQYLESAPKEFLVIGDRVIAVVGQGTKEYMTAKIYWTLVILKYDVYRFDQALNDLDEYTGKKNKIHKLKSLVNDERLIKSSENTGFSLNPARIAANREIISNGTEIYGLLTDFLLKEGKESEQCVPGKAAEITFPGNSLNPIGDKTLEFLRCFLLQYPKKDWTLSTFKYLLAKSTEENAKKFLESDPKAFIIVGTRVFVPSGNGVKDYLTTKICWSLIFSDNKEYSFDSALKDFDNFTGKEGHTDDDLYSLVQDRGLFNDWVNRCFTLKPGHHAKAREPLQAGPQLYDYLLHFLAQRNGNQALNPDMVVEEVPFLRQHPRFINMMKEYPQSQQPDPISLKEFQEIKQDNEGPNLDVKDSATRQKNLDFLHNLLLSYPGKDWTVPLLSFLLGELSEEKTKLILIESSRKPFLIMEGHVFAVVGGAKGFVTNKIYWTLVITKSNKYPFSSALKAFDECTGKSGHSESDLYALVQDDRIINDWDNRCFILNPKKNVPILETLTPGPEVYDLLLKVKINGKLQRASELIDTAPFMKYHPKCFNLSVKHQISPTEPHEPMPAINVVENPTLATPIEATENQKTPENPRSISLDEVFNYLTTMPKRKTLRGVELKTVMEHFSFPGKDKCFPDFLESDQFQRFVVDAGLVFVRADYKESSLEDYFVDLLCFHLKAANELIRFNQCEKFVENKLKGMKLLTPVPNLEKRIRSDSRFLIINIIGKKDKEYIRYNRDYDEKNKMAGPVKNLKPQVSNPVKDTKTLLGEKLGVHEKMEPSFPFPFSASNSVELTSTSQSISSLVEKLNSSLKSDNPVKKLSIGATKTKKVLSQPEKNSKVVPKVEEMRNHYSDGQLSLFTADSRRTSSLPFARIVHEHYSEEFMNFDNEKPKDPLFFNEKKEFTSLHCLFYENPQQKQKHENPLYSKLLNYFGKSSSKPDCSSSSSSSSFLVINETPLEFLKQYSSTFPFDYDRDRVEVLINPLYFQRKQSFYSSYSSKVQPLLIPWGTLVSSGSFDLLIEFLNLQQHKGDYYEFLSFLSQSFPDKNRTTGCSYDEFCQEIAKNNIQISQRILFLLDTFILESVTNRNTFPDENHSFQLFSSESTFIFCLDLQFSDEISKLSLLPVEDLQGIYSFLVNNFTARDEEFVGVVADQKKKGIFLGNVSFDFIESEAYDEAEVDDQYNKNSLHMKGIFPLSLVYALLRKEDLIVVVQQFYNPLMFLSSSWIENWDCVFFSSFSSKSSVHNVMKRLGIESSFSQDLFQSSLINLDEEDLLMYFPVGKRNHSLSQSLPWGLNSSDLKNFYHLTCRE